MLADDSDSPLLLEMIIGVERKYFSDNQNGRSAYLPFQAPHFEAPKEIALELLCSSTLE